jgi:hypothetical protein
MSQELEASPIEAEPEALPSVVNRQKPSINLATLSRDAMRGIERVVHWSYTDVAGVVQNRFHVRDGIGLNLDDRTH